MMPEAFSFLIIIMIALRRRIANGDIYDDEARGGSLLFFHLKPNAASTIPSAPLKTQRLLHHFLFSLPS